MDVYIIILTIFFWVSLLVIVYTYVGYALLLTVLVKLKGKTKKELPDIEWQPVTIVICAYNEEYIIEEKIKNTLELDYPRHLLTIMVVTDGSTDRTGELAQAIAGVKVSHSAERRGKVAAVNRIMPLISDPFVIFTDANTFLNPLAAKNIMHHYKDPTIGGVAGEKRVISEEGGATAGEGIYWKYESYLKKQDAALYSVVGAAGELFSIRTSLYDFVEEDTIIEDFVLSMRICGKGYRIGYESGAYAMETASISISEERKRKVRITAGAFQAMKRLGKEITFSKFPLLGFQYYSHRVLRWTVAPMAMIVFFLSGIALSVGTGNHFYVAVTVLQVVFYLIGIIGWKLSSQKQLPRLLFIPYYFLFMNISVFMGWNRYQKGQQSVIWEKAKRL